jgi:hypothetical protein
MSPDLLGDPNDVGHLGDCVHPHDVRAGQYGRGHGGGRAPIAFRGGTIARRTAQKRFP